MSKVYPVTLIWMEGSYIEVYPMLVEANNREHAHDISAKISDKLRPASLTKQYIKVGREDHITPTNAEMATNE